jgi:anti-sigma-K factor RskA
MKTRLIDYVEGRLSEAERRDVESRIERDAAWRQAYDDLLRTLEWLKKEPLPDRDMELYWSGFNARLRRRMAERISENRRPRRWMPAVAAAAVVLIGVTWTLFFASPDERSETTAEAEVTWDEEAMSYGTSIDYPAVVQSEFDDLSSDEERTLLAELNEAVIL